jgi:hypothetical protein
MNTKQSLAGIFALLFSSVVAGQNLPEGTEFRQPTAHTRKMKDGTCDTTGLSYKAIPREVFVMGGFGAQVPLANHNFVKPGIGTAEVRVHNLLNDTTEFSTYAAFRTEWNFVGTRTNEQHSPITAGSKKGEIYNYSLAGGVGTASKAVSLAKNTVSHLYTGVEGGFKVVRLEDVNYVSPPPTPNGANKVALAGNRTTKVGPQVGANIIYVVDIGKHWSVAASGYMGWDGVKYNSVPNIDVDDDNWDANIKVAAIFYPFARD